MTTMFAHTKSAMIILFIVVFVVSRSTNAHPHERSTSLECHPLDHPNPNIESSAKSSLWFQKYSIQSRHHTNTMNHYPLYNAIYDTSCESFVIVNIDQTQRDVDYLLNANVPERRASTPSVGSTKSMVEKAFNKLKKLATRKRSAPAVLQTFTNESVDLPPLVNGQLVPIVATALDVIQRPGNIIEQGIFRISPSLQSFNNLLRNSSHLEFMTVHEAARVLKMSMKNIIQNQDEIFKNLQAGQFESKQALIAETETSFNAASFLNTLKMNAGHNASYLDLVFSLLAKVALQSDKNLMNSHNLASLFTPNLFNNLPISDKETHQIITNAIASLIHYHQ